jgi:hypothetical protein
LAVNDKCRKFSYTIQKLVFYVKTKVSWRKQTKLMNKRTGSKAVAIVFVLVSFVRILTPHSDVSAEQAASMFSQRIKR